MKQLERNIMVETVTRVNTDTREMETGRQKNRQRDKKRDKSFYKRNEFILGAWWLSVTCRNEQIHLEN